MKLKRLNKLKRSYVSGSPDKRLAAARDAVVVLEQDRVRLLDSLDHQRDEYTRTQEAWESRRIAGNLRPQAIQQDAHDGRLYILVAWVLAIAEVTLFWVLAAGLGVNPLFSLMLAVVLTWGLKTALLALWRDPAQPLETKRRLKNIVLTPSLILLLLAGGALMFARVAGGALALLLLDGINVALFMLSVSCLGLASGLFAVGYLLLWSWRAELTYEVAERELVAVMCECRVVAEIIHQLDPNKDGEEDRPFPSSTRTSKILADRSKERTFRN